MEVNRICFVVLFFSALLSLLLSVTPLHMFIHKGYIVSFSTDYLHIMKLVEEI